MDEFEIKVKTAPQSNRLDRIGDALEALEAKTKALFMRPRLVVAMSATAFVLVLGTPHIGVHYQCGHRMSGPNTCREYLSCTYYGIQGRRVILPHDGERCGLFRMLTPDWARLLGRG